MDDVFNSPNVMDLNPKILRLTFKVVYVWGCFPFQLAKPICGGFWVIFVFFYGKGMAVYAFQGIGMMLPLEFKTKDKEKFGRVMGFSMDFITVLYGAFETLCYFAFGKNTKDLITSNLGLGFISNIIKLDYV
uniref:Amino acid transporter transmembrane domain-containing protein n=1 Tax=Cucumis melo TaxID=3656 RepID=A0A9I9DJL3_CUCME